MWRCCHADLSANVHHLYIGASSDIPREFVKMSGDALLKTFDFTNYNALVDIAPLFEVMEITNSEDGDQEFVNKVIVRSVLGSVAGIGWILACVFCISCCVVCIRKRKTAQSMTDYVEFKTNPSI